MAHMKIAFFLSMTKELEMKIHICLASKARHIFSDQTFDILRGESRRFETFLGLLCMKSKSSYAFIYSFVVTLRLLNIERANKARVVVLIHAP